MNDVPHTSREMSKYYLCEYRPGQSRYQADDPDNSHHPGGHTLQGKALAKMISVEQILVGHTLVGQFLEGHILVGEILVGQNF